MKKLIESANYYKIDEAGDVQLLDNRVIFTTERNMKDRKTYAYLSRITGYRTARDNDREFIDCESDLDSAQGHAHEYYSGPEEMKVGDSHVQVDESELKPGEIYQFGVNLGMSRLHSVVAKECFIPIYKNKDRYEVLMFKSIAKAHKYLKAIKKQGKGLMATLKEDHAELIAEKEEKEVDSDSHLTA